MTTQSMRRVTCNQCGLMLVTISQQGDGIKHLVLHQDLTVILGNGDSRTSAITCPNCGHAVQIRLGWFSRYVQG